MRQVSAVLTDIVAAGLLLTACVDAPSAPGQAEPSQPAFACDPACRAQQLVFVRDEHICTLVNGQARLLTGTGRDDAPAWSPDGRRIAFVRYDQGWPGAIHLMNADGSNAVRRADGFHSPAWSPDGRLLAVATGGGWDGDIYLLSVDELGTVPVHIASMAAQPAWSPDGTKIAFVRLSGDDGYHELHVMNADGSGVTALTLVDEGAIDHPSWSPDGRRIAFAKCIQGACNIFAVDADGSAAVQQLTTVHSSKAFDPAAFHPAWSPDGTRIALTLRSGSGGQSIAYISADGGEPILLTPRGHSPAWRP